MLQLQENETEAIPEIDCSEGAMLITPTAFGSSICTVHVQPQVTGGAVNLERVGEYGVKVDFELTEIDSTRTGSEACGPAEPNSGTLTGSVVLAPGILQPTKFLLNFAPHKEKKVTTFRLENIGEIPVDLRSAWIQDVNGTKTGKPNYAIVPGGMEGGHPACLLPGKVPFDTINAGTSCVVAIETLVEEEWTEQYRVIPTVVTKQSPSQSVDLTR